MKNILLKLFKDTKIDLTKAYFVPFGGMSYLGNKFDITPKDFLRFAKEDLKQDDDRGFINCLSNSKRAIDCQIDEALDKLGIKCLDFNNEINDFLINFDLYNEVPLKLKIIHALNLAPSLLISKTRTLRNQLEHIYQKPSKMEVKEALDVADLFIRSVEGKFKSLTDEFGITDEQNYYPDADFKHGLRFCFDSNKFCFKINKLIDNKTVENAILSSEDIGYYGILRLMFSIDDEIELDESLKATIKHIGHPMPSEKVSIIQA